MAEESRRTGADKLQAQEHTNHKCTLYLHRKKAGGEEQIQHYRVCKGLEGDLGEDTRSQSLM